MKHFIFLFSIGLSFFSCVLSSDDKLYNSTDNPYINELESMRISWDGSSITFKYEENPSADTQYQWYKSFDDTYTNCITLNGETNNSFSTGSLEKGIHYYYCTSTNASLSETKYFSVAYTGLPLIIIDTINMEEPTAEYVSAKENGGNYGATLKNATKVPAKMHIFKDGSLHSIYNSGDYSENTAGLTIKLRGNTSAYGQKKPYKLKLQDKEDLLADIIGRNAYGYKSKDWLLLNTATSLCTVIGFAVSDIAGIEWTPEYAFVDVVLNGNYKGCYLLCEAISRGAKRINVSDEGYIIERDAYWWNTDVKFITDLNQKYTFKYPDSDSISASQITYIKNYMNHVEKEILNGTYEAYIDTESFARWQLIHDILGTWDACGSNIYMSKYDSTENSKIRMCTPWDFDSIFRMKNAWSNVHHGNRIYSQLLFSNSNSAFLDSYKAQWNSLSSILENEVSAELNKLYTKSGNAINLSRQFNSKRWNITFNTIESDITKANTWFTNRTNWLNTQTGGM